MYTAVLDLFYLPKQEPYFILEAHQVKKQHRTLFQQQCFSSPFFDLCNTSTLQPQTLQPDRPASLWECMWISAHKKIRKTVFRLLIWFFFIHNCFYQIIIEFFLLKSLVHTDCLSMRRKISRFINLIDNIPLCFFIKV